MTNYLLDTDHVIGLIGSDKPIIERMRRSIKTGDRFSICVTTLSELYWFAKSTAQMETNTAALTELVADLTVLEMDRGAAEIVGELLLEHRSMSLPMPRAVAEVAAIARQEGLVVLSSDESFRDVRDIQWEDWRGA